MLEKGPPHSRLIASRNWKNIVNRSGTYEVPPEAEVKRAENGCHAMDAIWRGFVCMSVLHFYYGGSRSYHPQRPSFNCNLKNVFQNSEIYYISTKMNKQINKNSSKLPLPSPAIHRIPHSCFQLQFFP